MRDAAAALEDKSIETFTLISVGVSDGVGEADEDACVRVRVQFIAGEASADSVVVDVAVGRTSAADTVQSAKGRRANTDPVGVDLVGRTVNS